MHVGSRNLHSVNVILPFSPGLLLSSRGRVYGYQEIGVGSLVLGCHLSVLMSFKEVYHVDWFSVVKTHRLNLWHPSLQTFEPFPAWLLLSAACSSQGGGSQGRESECLLSNLTLKPPELLRSSLMPFLPRQDYSFQLGSPSPGWVLRTLNERPHPRRKSPLVSDLLGWEIFS